MKKVIVETSVLSSDLLGRIRVEEACHLFGVDEKFYVDLVDQGVFEVADLHTIPATYISVFRKAARLHIDLGVNPAGIAVILDLLAQRR